MESSDNNDQKRKSDGETFMDPDELGIRLCHESQRWEQMIDKIYEWLQKNKEANEAKKNKQQKIERQITTKRVNSMEFYGEMADTKDLRENMPDKNGILPTTKFYELTGKTQMHANQFKELYEALNRVTTYVITPQMKQLIAAAFKGRLSEIRESLKMIKILKNRTTVEKKHEMMEAYEEGLRKDLREKALDLI